MMQNMQRSLYHKTIRQCKEGYEKHETSSSAKVFLNFYRTIALKDIFIRKMIQFNTMQRWLMLFMLIKRLKRQVNPIGKIRTENMKQDRILTVGELNGYSCQHRCLFISGASISALIISSPKRHQSERFRVRIRVRANFMVRVRVSFSDWWSCYQSQNVNFGLMKFLTDDISDWDHAPFIYRPFQCNF